MQPLVGRISVTIHRQQKFLGCLSAQEYDTLGHDSIGDSIVSHNCHLTPLGEGSEQLVRGKGIIWPLAAKGLFVAFGRD